MLPTRLTAHERRAYQWGRRCFEHGDVEPALEYLVALRAAYPKLREAVLALEETLDDLEETLPYADDYFKKKWRLGRSLKRGRVVLRALGEGRDDETD